MDLTEKLWTSKEAAQYAGVSRDQLRMSTCPRELVPGVNGTRERVRYVPAAVRAWVKHNG